MMEKRSEAERTYEAEKKKLEAEQGDRPKYFIVLQVPQEDEEDTENIF